MEGLLSKLPEALGILVMLYLIMVEARKLYGEYSNSQNEKASVNVNVAPVAANGNGNKAVIESYQALVKQMTDNSDSAAKQKQETLTKIMTLFEGNNAIVQELSKDLNSMTHRIEEFNSGITINTTQVNRMLGMVERMCEDKFEALLGCVEKSCEEMKKTVKERGD